MHIVRSAVATIVVTALLVAGPIGAGGVAAAAEGGGQESRLQREIDRLSPAQRTKMEQQMSDRLAESGIDLEDPKVQARIANLLGVSTAEIKHAVEGAEGSAKGLGSAPVWFLFVAAALLFLPSLFQSIGDTIFGLIGEVGGIEGVEPF